MQRADPVVCQIVLLPSVTQRKMTHTSYTSISVLLENAVMLKTLSARGVVFTTYAYLTERCHS